MVLDESMLKAGRELAALKRQRMATHAFSLVQVLEEIPKALARCDASGEMPHVMLSEFGMGFHLLTQVKMEHWYIGGPMIVPAKSIPRLKSRDELLSCSLHFWLRVDGQIVASTQDEGVSTGVAHSSTTSECRIEHLGNITLDALYYAVLRLNISRGLS